MHIKVYSKCIEYIPLVFDDLCGLWRGFMAIMQVNGRSIEKPLKVHKLFLAHFTWNIHQRLRVNLIATKLLKFHPCGGVPMAHSLLVWSMEPVWEFYWPRHNPWLQGRIPWLLTFIVFFFLKRKDGNNFHWSYNMQFKATSI